MFICHGNICRSPLAEFVLKSLAQKAGISDELYIRSAATSQEEIGNSVYPPVRKLLNDLGIDCSEKKACQISRKDTEEFDYIIAMEEFNLRNLYYLYPDMDKSKVHLLLDFTDSPKDIDDPWYTRDFNKAYDEILRGCIAFLHKLADNGKITLKNKELFL